MQEFTPEDFPRLAAMLRFSGFLGAPLLDEFAFFMSFSPRTASRQVFVGGVTRSGRSASAVGWSLAEATARVLGEAAEHVAAADDPDGGEGYGAGADQPMAQLHGILERIERDAVVRWWTGQTEAVGLDFDGFERIAAELYGRPAIRPVRLLEIPNSLGVSVVVCYAFNKDGGGFASGSCAAASLGRAIDGAVRELAQMEAGAEIIAMKIAEFGVETINDHDRETLQRSAAIDGGRFDASTPTRRRVVAQDLNAAGQLTSVGKLLSAIAPDAFVKNLGEIGGLSVAKALTPGLASARQAPPSVMPGAEGVRFW